MAVLSLDKSTFGCPLEMTYQRAPRRRPNSSPLVRDVLWLCTKAQEDVGMNIDVEQLQMMWCIESEIQLVVGVRDIIAAVLQDTVTATVATGLTAQT